MSRPELKVKIISNDEKVIKYYEDCAAKSKLETYADSGFDLVVANDVIFTSNDKTKLLPFGIQCSPNFKSGYHLYPRSSIYNTPFRMANCVGIIDQGYRGEIKAPVDVISSLPKGQNEDVSINKLTRLFQLCHPSLQPMIII